MELSKVKVSVRCRIRWKKTIKHDGCYMGLHHSSRLVCQVEGLKKNLLRKFNLSAQIYIYKIDN